MYSHLTASVAMERTEDDLHHAHLSRRARTAQAPQALEDPLGRKSPTPRVRWPRRGGQQQARPARA